MFRLSLGTVPLPLGPAPLAAADDPGLAFTPSAPEAPSTPAVEEFDRVVQPRGWVAEYLQYAAHGIGAAGNLTADSVTDEAELPEDVPGALRTRICAVHRDDDGRWCIGGSSDVEPKLPIALVDLSESDGGGHRLSTAAPVYHLVRRNEPETGAGPTKPATYL
jgi:hypothetical protein